MNIFLFSVHVHLSHLSVLLIFGFAGGTAAEEFPAHKWAPRIYPEPGYLLHVPLSGHVCVFKHLPADRI